MTRKDLTLDEIEYLDHNCFGHWLDAGPADYDQLSDDTARLYYVLEKIHEFRCGIGTVDGEDMLGGNE